MSDDSGSHSNARWWAPAPVVAIATWLVPGSGYLLLGQFARGLTIGLTVLGLFVMGVLIGGVHVVDPPTFTKGANYVGEVLQKPAYIGQFLAGAIGIYAGRVGPGQPASHSRVSDIGTLYTAVAGMLNLMAIIDSSYRATLPHFSEAEAEEADETEAT